MHFKGVPQAIANNAAVQLQVQRGLQNPEQTVRLYGSFLVTTYQSDGYAIDQLSDQLFSTLTTTVAFSAASIARTNQTNGGVGDYTFRLRSPFPIVAGYRVSLTFPTSEIAVPATLECLYRGASVACAQSQSRVVFTLPENLASEIQFELTVRGVRNYLSLRPLLASTFRIQLSSDNVLHLMCDQSLAVPVNLEPGVFQTATLEP